MARLDNSGALDRNKSQPLGSELKQKMYESGQTAREKLSDKTEELTQKAVNLSEQQKSIGAQQLQTVASAAHTAAGELEQNMPQAANLVHAAATKLDSAATALRERRIDDLMSDINDFARERPWLVFGGAVLAGFAMTRFVKSSANGDGVQLMGEGQSSTQPRSGMQNETRTAASSQSPNVMPKGDSLDRNYEGMA
jgi:hypothetical protein